MIDWITNNPNTVTALATVGLLLFAALGVAGKQLRSAVTVLCKYSARIASHICRVAFSWVKEIMGRLYSRICSRNRKAALHSQRLYLAWGIGKLIRESERQRTNALVVEQDTACYDRLARRRIVAAMHAREGGLQDAIAIISEGEQVPHVEKTSTDWRYVQGGDPTYGCLERIDKRWRFNRKIYFNKELTEEEPPHPPDWFTQEPPPTPLPNA